MNILLISTYELGRQPFGLASPAAWLREAGHTVRQQDLSQEKLDSNAVRTADLIALYLPMHTATRIAMRVIERVRQLNPAAHFCAYGLYAPMNADLLRESGVQTILGGEFEQVLCDVAAALARGDRATSPQVSLERLRFHVPDRTDLPELACYARLVLPDGSRRVVGYTEATRGCKHRCRHCPIVPVYNGAFRVIQRDVAMEDIRRQVAAGAQHITFGDPDFFNGVQHSLELVRALHCEFPAVSYDVTIKVEHLLKHAQHLPVLRDTGCAFVTSAVESLDDAVLEKLDKGHTRADFLRVVALMREIGLPLTPTFVPFTPWTTLESYADLLRTLADHDLIDNVPPVQLSIRLLIPAGSRLLELEEVRALVGEFDAQALAYPWKNDDPRVDELQCELEKIVECASLNGEPRRQTFRSVWQRVQSAMQQEIAFPELDPLPARATIPYLTEPWYC